MNTSNDWQRSYRENWRSKPLAHIAGLTLALSLLFALFPGLDLWFSRFFHAPGEGFPARRVEVLLTIRAIGQYFPLTFAIVVIVAVILKLVYPSRRCLFPARFTVYFASLFLLGPGLLVNGILKPFWDRPRPVSTLEFGGLHPFIGAWTPGGAFFENRSFVSGETAGVVCLLPLALFVPPEWRRSVLWLLAIFAAAISLNRIAFGAHFLSDVLISAALMLGLAVGLWKLVYSSASVRFSEEALEDMLSRTGNRAHAACQAIGATGVESFRSALVRMNLARAS